MLFEFGVSFTSIEMLHLPISIGVYDFLIFPNIDLFFVNILKSE